MKKNKVLTLIISLAMLCMCFTYVSAESISGITYEISENFTDCEIDGSVWSVVGDANSVSVTKEGNNDVLMLSANGAGVGYKYNDTISDKEYVDVSLKAKIAETGKLRLNFLNEFKTSVFSLVIQPGAGLSTVVHNLRNASQALVKNSIVPMEVSADIWHLITVRINTQSGTFSLYLDDALIGENILIGAQKNPSEIYTFKNSTKMQIVSAGIDSSDLSLGTVLVDDVNINRVTRNNIVPSDNYFSDLSNLNIAQCSQLAPAFTAAREADGISLIDFGGEHGVAQQLKALGSDRNVNAEVTLDTEVTQGVFAAEFDYYADEGVIPSVMLKTGTNNSVDVFNSSLIGNAEIVYNQWAHVKMTYDVTANSFMAEYNGTEIIYDNASVITNPLKNSQILGVLFQNKNEAGLKFSIDNLKTSNISSEASGTGKGFNQSDFQNPSENWGSYLGTLHDVTVDEQHGSSLYVPINGKDANAWSYRTFDEAVINGVLKVNFKTNIKAAEGSDTAISHCQIGVGNGWNLSAGRVLLEFSENGNITANGTLIGAYEHGVWYNCELQINIDTKEVLATITTEDGETVGLPARVPYTAVCADTFVLKGYHGTEGFYVDDISIGYVDATPTAPDDKMAIYDYDDTQITDIYNVPVSATKLSIDMGANIDAATADKIYIVDSNGIKVKAINSVLGMVCTLKFEEQLKTDTNYELYIDRTVANNDGLKLGEDRRISFKTAPGVVEGTINNAQINFNNAEVANMTARAKISVNMNILNTVENKQIPYMLIAYYDNDVMVDVTYCPIVLNTATINLVAGVVTVSDTVPHDIPEFNKVKVFLWDGVGSMLAAADELVIR